MPLPRGVTQPPADAAVRWRIAVAGHEPLTSSQRAQFVTGCENTGGAVVNCQCLLNRLEADGYTTLDRLRIVVDQADAERASGESGAALNELASDTLACRLYP